ncbi:MAG: PhzF family phenazine biosynthesis protein [Planctomycetes bacterium]|nr:PhzF family phenazine biosynthesis protein [Planctomycetota bacterium]
MPTVRYHRVDVFTEVPFSGNPLAVFPEGDGLDARTMQAIAREMNLSETVFCVRPSEREAAVRLRIFTVDRELPLAGHPTVGTLFVLAATGRIPLHGARTEVKVQLGAGVLPVAIHADQGTVKSVTMTQRTPAFGLAVRDREFVARALGVRPEQIGPGELPIRVVDVGVPWLLVPMIDLRALRNLQPDPTLCREVARIAGTDFFYVFTQETDDPGCAAHARHAWYGVGTPGEDPVTGSAAGCLASYLVLESVLLAAPTAELRIEQGAEVGRPGQITAIVDADGTRVRRVQVGGAAVHLGDGELWLS